MLTFPRECLDTGEVKSRGMEKLQNEELHFSPQPISVRVTPDVLFGERRLDGKMILK